MGMMIDLQPSMGRALVVGGGIIALRKLRNLREGGFACVAIAPAIRDEIRLLGGTMCLEREFEDSDIVAGLALVFACTDDREVNMRVGALARAAGIPVVVTDAQAESTFFTPAILRDGEVTVAVSTGGASPSSAKAIRTLIANALGSGFGRMIDAGIDTRRQDQ
jgi:siroheme synthase-like protein